MDDNPEIRDRLNVNKSTYHNKRPRERFICFIRGAKWIKINQLNGPSPIHDTSTWLSQSIQSIRHVCCWLGMQKILPWKCYRTAFGHYDFPSTSASGKFDACANVTTCCSNLLGSVHVGILDGVKKNQIQGVCWTTINNLTLRVYLFLRHIFLKNWIKKRIALICFIEITSILAHAKTQLNQAGLFI